MMGDERERKRENFGERKRQKSINTMVLKKTLWQASSAFYADTLDTEYWLLQEVGNVEIISGMNDTPLKVNNDTTGRSSSFN